MHLLIVGVLQEAPIARIVAVHTLVIKLLVLIQNLRATVHQEKAIQHLRSHLST
jgi:hypothetical protein